MASLSYMERNSLCDSYNRRVNLHLATYINKEDNQGKKNAVYFADQSKNQFAKKLDNLILIIFCGFGVVIISQMGINKKKQLENKEI